jgi:hypothetical protein
MSVRWRGRRLLARLHDRRRSSICRGITILKTDCVILDHGSHGVNAAVLSWNHLPNGMLPLTFAHLSCPRIISHSGSKGLYQLVICSHSRFIGAGLQILEIVSIVLRLMEAILVAG